MGIFHQNFRSNPGTPTQVRRPDFIGVPNQQQQQPGLAYYDFPMHQQQQMMMLQQQQNQQGIPYHAANGSPQRRFLSEGELLGRATSNGLSIGNELSYMGRNNNTVDNIRELAGSPQRGVYNWKDQSPPGYNNPNQMPPGPVMYTVAPTQQTTTNTNNNMMMMGRPPLPTNQQSLQQNYQDFNMYRSNPTSPTQNQIVGQSNVSNIINNIVANSANSSGSYHPALRGGIQVFPPQIPASPQVKRKQTPTRPISFVRALEMADSMEMTNTNVQQMDPSDSISKNNVGIIPNMQQQQQQIVDRESVYDMNYEISV